MNLNKSSNVTYIQDLIATHASQISFMIGNGINRYYHEASVSWSDLLLNLWNNNTEENKITYIPEGISFTEFFDILEIQSKKEKNLGGEIQKQVQSAMQLWKGSAEQNHLLQKIRSIKAPILTTNFDNLMQQTMQLKMYKIVTTPFTDYYPWSCYYGTEQLTTPTAGFGIWHINGMIKYHRSIKLGLSQYMGNVAQARKFIHKGYQNLYAQDAVWNGSNTWLDIVFHKPIMILGLGLDETEVFIRWLLIERAKYFKKTKTIQKGWYIEKSTSRSEISEGKRFFLESVGIEIITLDNYKELYVDIWN